MSDEPTSVRRRSGPGGERRRGAAARLVAAVVAAVVLAVVVLAAGPSGAGTAPPGEPAAPGGAPAEDQPGAPADDACSALTGETLVVAVKDAQPFVFVEPDGEPSGFSIELWQLIAGRLGVETDYVVVDTVPQLLDEVAAGRADVANAAISITADRHQRMDFTTPTFTSGLRVLVSPQDDPTFGEGFGRLFETYLVWAALAFVGLVVVAGTIVWLIERRRNPEFHHGIAGIGEGMWWAVVTMFTVGYGDRVARTPWGRLFSALWILVGIVLVAQFTATITAGLTVDELTAAPTSLDALADDRVVTVRDTAAAALLDQRNIPSVLVGSVDEMVDEVAEGRADAAVYDGPILEHRATLDRRLAVVGEPLSLDYYGMAVPTGSDRLECIDRALAEVVEDGTWQRLHDSWFGI